MEMPLERVTVEPLDREVLALWLPAYSERLSAVLGRERAAVFAEELRGLLYGPGATGEVFAHGSPMTGAFTARLLPSGMPWRRSRPHSLGDSPPVAELLARGLLQRQRLERLLIPVPEDL